MIPDSASRLTDISGVKVGHWSDCAARTGVTVIIFDKTSVASCHVAGGAPGSQETDLLDPSCLVAGVNAITLAGGSAFGLASTVGVRRYLEEKGKGFKAGGQVVPIVPAAVIFDLSSGNKTSRRPGPDEGYLACENSEIIDRSEGALGVGTGATVGKYIGMTHCAPGGMVSRSVTTCDGIMVGALMVANCYGAVTDPADNSRIAGPKKEDGSHLSYLEAQPNPPDFGSTAIGVVVTDACLTKSDLKRVAIMAHDGLAGCVFPAHTPYDGDLIFAVSTGEKKGDVARIGAWSAKLVERCIVEAALPAEQCGAPSQSTAKGD